MKKIFLLLLFFVGGVNYPVWGADNLTLSGVLMEPPKCEFNGALLIAVNFGARVGVNKVDGNNYKKKIPYVMYCEAESKPWDLAFILTGEVTSYDNAAVKTNIDDLGIRILVDGKPFTLNQAVPISWNKPPIIEAVPVKKPGSTLKAGAFNASATIRINYQ